MPRCIYVRPPSRPELGISRVLAYEAQKVKVQWLFTRNPHNECRPSKIRPMSTEERLIHQICDALYPGGFVMITELDDCVEARVQFWEHGHPNEAVAFADTRVAALEMLASGENVEKYLADPAALDEWPD